MNLIFCLNAHKNNTFIMCHALVRFIFEYFIENGELINGRGRVHTFDNFWLISELSYVIILDNKYLINKC